MEDEDQQTKKTNKVEAKAKPKAKAIKLSKMMKETPAAVTQAFVADVTAVDSGNVGWSLDSF